MVFFPHCKINLGLQIISKREDGYHNIETCFYPVPWRDALEVIKSDQFQFTQSGTSIPGREEDNLCIKAYQLLKKDFDLQPIKLHLHKVIPTGAGLGGGSSDAAFTLRALSAVFNLNLSTVELANYAAMLGSDCSFFVSDKPMLGSGRGEILSETSINLKGKYLILVKPDIHVSTAEAYAGIIPKQPVQSIKEVLELPVAEWKEKLKNDFEESVFKKHPQIETIKKELYSQGALFASMSGSGACVFGIFESPLDLKNKFSGVYWAGKLN
jgi:4-diphosphocytidyl-2-C-methyl-D-erythritol kinase